MNIQDIKLKPLIKALLWAGIEDYCALWAAVWEINSLLPDVSKNTKFDLTRTLVKSLLDAGDIHLVRLENQNIVPIPISDSPSILEDIHNWDVPKTLDDIQICFDTTDIGQERYKSMSS